MKAKTSSAVTIVNVLFMVMGDQGETIGAESVGFMAKLNHAEQGSSQLYLEDDARTGDESAVGAHFVWAQCGTYKFACRLFSNKWRWGRSGCRWTTHCRTRAI